MAGRRHRTRWGGLVGVVVIAGALLAMMGCKPAIGPAPDVVRGRLEGRGTMEGKCPPGVDGVRLDAVAAMRTQSLGNGQAVWTTCVLQFGGTHLDVAPQTFTFTTNGGTLSGTVTDATLEHAGGPCLPTNLVGQWTVGVTVDGLVGTGKFASVTGGQLNLDYLWTRADGGTCPELPGFPLRDMVLHGVVFATLT